MSRSFLKSFLNAYVLVFLVLFLAGCYFYSRPAEELFSPKIMQKVGWWSRPSFHDDLKIESLLAAIEKNNEYLEKLPPSRLISYGNQKYSVREVKESFRHFISILENSTDDSDLNDKIIKDFDIYSSVGYGSKKKVLFTGYYEPVMKGSREKTEYYKYPLYGKPKDLVQINLGDYRQDLKGKKIIVRIDNKTIAPYYDRKSIDKFGYLSGQGLEIAWLSDPIDVFFLQIQGSGIIEIVDGSAMNVNYAAANGKEYRSIGRLLIEEGKVPKEKMSMKSIREYLSFYPEEVERILYHNESYVFFRVVENGPIGSTTVPLTGGRSIASDSRIYPKGGLAYIETEVPVTDEEGNVTGWKKIFRFVVDQDSGGAIKGPARIDLFFGTGSDAAKSAGAMNRYGKIFYLIKKR